MRTYKSAGAALLAAQGISKKTDTYMSIFYNGDTYGVDYTYENGEGVKSKDGFVFLSFLLHNWPEKDKPTEEEIEKKAKEISEKKNDKN
jgi:hypothetical protein